MSLTGNDSNRLRSRQLRKTLEEIYCLDHYNYRRQLLLEHFNTSVRLRSGIGAVVPWGSFHSSQKIKSQQDDCRHVQTNFSDLVGRAQAIARDALQTRSKI